MKEIETISKITLEVLREEPEARDSDDYLYFKVCSKINPIYMQLPFFKVMLHRKEYGLPKFETVRRTRQKAQATFPELRGSDDVEAGRMLLEEEYEKYALSSIG